MATFSGVDATQALMTFTITHGSKLPSDQRDFLLQTLVDTDFLRKVIVGMEVLYASRGAKSFPKPGVELMHDLASFVQANNFYGLQDRAIKLMAVAQRMLQGGAAEAEGDEPISAEYSAPAPVEAPVAPMAPASAPTEGAGQP